MIETPQGPADVSERIVGNFEITLNLSDKRGIRVTGYIYDKDDSKRLNARIDWLQDTLDRQFIRADGVNTRAQITYEKINIDAQQNAAEGLINKRNGGKKLSSQEQLMLNNLEPNVHAAKQRIESLDAAIQAAEKTLAMT